MDSVAPPLSLLLCVKRNIEGGNSVRTGVLVFVNSHKDPFTEQVGRWLSLHQQGLSVDGLMRELSSPQRRSVLQILQRGLEGEAVYKVLCSLEEELVEACKDELAKKLSRLPFLLMGPLLLFQFPAFLILLFGPLMNNFFHTLGAQ